MEKRKKAMLGRRRKKKGALNKQSSFQIKKFVKIMLLQKRFKHKKPQKQGPCYALEQGKKKGNRS
jgi:hypothetical protein